MHRNSLLIKIQPDATVCRYLFTAKSLYMFRVSQHPSSGVLKTVTAASGTGHNIGTATSLQHGLRPRWREPRIANLCNKLMCLTYIVLLFDYFITHRNNSDQTNRTVLPDTVYASRVTSLYFFLCCVYENRTEIGQGTTCPIGYDVDSAGIVV